MNCIFAIVLLVASGVARPQLMPGDARAQRGLTTFASSLVPRPRPALSHLQYGMQKQLGMLPQKILSFIGQFWGYFRPYCHLEWGTSTMPLLQTCARSVRPL